MSCTKSFTLGVFLIGLLNAFLALAQCYYITVIHSLRCECKNHWLQMIKLYTYFNMIFTTFMTFLCASQLYLCVLNTRAFKIGIYSVYALTIVYFVISYLSLKNILNKDCKCVAPNTLFMVFDIYESIKKLIASMGVATLLIVIVVVIFGVWFRT